MKSSHKGFSLIELMIAVLILGVITSVAVPAYQNHILSSRRADGHMALLTAAQDLERCKTRTFTYANCNVIGDNSASAEGFYTLAVSDVSATSFQLTATPTGAQTNDTDCEKLLLNESGTRTASGALAEECW